MVGFFGGLAGLTVALTGLRIEAAALPLMAIGVVLLVVALNYHVNNE